MKSRTLRTLGLATLLVSSAWAQLATPVKANVPFDFAAGTTRFAAGDYTVMQLNQGIIRLADADGKKAVILMANQVSNSQTAAGPALIFHRYGGSYFLSQVWSNGGAGVRFLTTPAEKELAKATPRGESRVVARNR